MARQERTLTLVAIGIVLLGLLGLWGWNTRFSPEATGEAGAKAAAEQFWQAVVAGDVDGARSYLTSDSPIRLEEWVAQYQGMSEARVFDMVKALDNPCGLQWTAAVSVVSRNGSPHSQLLLLKQVGGKWLVHQGQGLYCQ